MKVQLCIFFKITVNLAFYEIVVLPHYSIIMPFFADMFLYVQTLFLCQLGLSLSDYLYAKPKPNFAKYFISRWPKVNLYSFTILKNKYFVVKFWELKYI